MKHFLIVQLYFCYTLLVLSEADEDGFSGEATRSMVSLMDCDRTGMLGFEEFMRLWNKLRMWKV